ncbi:hypothetical protein DFJ73DRAFT_929048 [Zopfochytrium polystomum]|nr:hypothetical protein DFJ73DRAFT_929048 [Zopfochytrium polystomum]
MHTKKSTESQTTRIHLLTLAAVGTASAVSASGFPFGNTNLNNVEAFVYTALITLFNDRDLTVVDKAWLPNYIQHNPTASNGVDALKAFVSYSNLTYDVGMVTSQQNIVATHSLVTDGATNTSSVIVDFFRVSGGRIAEHWDIIQPFTEANLISPATERNGYLTNAAACDPGKGPANIAFVQTALNQLFTNKSVVVEDYVRDPYLQHHPGVPGNITGLKLLLASFGPTATMPFEFGLATAKCDVVFVHDRFRFPGANVTSVATDIFRVRDGRLVEHWDVVMDEVPRDKTASGNAIFDTAEVTLIEPVDQSLYGPVGKYAVQASASASGYAAVTTTAGSIYYSAAVTRRDMLPWAFLQPLVKVKLTFGLF